MGGPAPPPAYLDTGQNLNTQVLVRAWNNHFPFFCTSEDHVALEVYGRNSVPRSSSELPCWWGWGGTDGEPHDPQLHRAWGGLHPDSRGISHHPQRSHPSPPASLPG